MTLDEMSQASKLLTTNTRAMFSHVDWRAHTARTSETIVLHIDETRQPIIDRLRQHAYRAYPSAIVKNKVLKQIIEAVAREFNYHREILTDNPKETYGILPVQRHGEYWVKQVI